MEEPTYPVSEIFTSPQGEGVYAGTMMTFVRLAGCTVGKPYDKKLYDDKYFPIYTDRCTLYDGREFPCDTDYRKKDVMKIEQILFNIPDGVNHVCITGGEPMMHPLVRLVDALHREPFGNSMLVHIETSGTLPLKRAFPNFTSHAAIWFTVSPKKGVLPEMIARADEIKILVDHNFKFEDLPVSIIQHKCVYIQPVNGEHTINTVNLKLVMELQKEYPHFRVSLQLHKVIEHFIGEHVR